MWFGCVKVKKLVTLVARTALMVRKMGWINGEEEVTSSKSLLASSYIDK